MKKRIVMLLCLIVAVCAVLCSCDKRGKNTTTTTTTSTGTTSSKQGSDTTTTTDKWDNIDFGTKEIKIQMNEYTDSEFEDGSKKYIQGPDEASSDNVQNLVYNRNQEAYGILNVDVKYSYINQGWSLGSGVIKTTEESQADCPDMYSDMLYDMMIATFNKCFSNVQTMTVDYRNADSSQGGYFDFSEDNGYMMEFMEGLRFSTDKQYILGSRYYLDLVRGMMVLPVNLDMYQAKVEDTAKFYQEILNGKWTWDYLVKVSKKVYNDKTGDGTTMDDDLGFAVETMGGKAASGIVYSTDIQVVDTKLSDDGVTYSFTYSSSSPELFNLFQKIAEVFSENTGVSVASEAKSTQIQGEEIRKKFSEGSLLFGGCIVMGSIESEVYQNDMKDSFGLVPIPKLSEADEYATLIHNVARCGAISRNIKPDSIYPVSAFIQYCSENSYDIVNQYYNYAMKNKYTSDAGTSEMLDMIYDNVVSNREKAIEDLLGALTPATGAYKWHGMLISDEKDYKTNASQIASLYTSAVSMKQSALDDAVLTWKALP